MSEELKNICENCNFDNSFQELLEGMECFYNSIKEHEGGEESLTMFEWIVENTKIDELNCLSEKEKFLFGLGVLMREMENY